MTNGGRRGSGGRRRGRGSGGTDVANDPLDYEQPIRKREPLWWRITEIGIYLSVGLILLTLVVNAVILIRQYLM